LGLSFADDRTHALSFVGIVTETEPGSNRASASTKMSMTHLSYRRHRFPPPIIQHAIGFVRRRIRDKIL
jgi:hypothetical protein